jgi:hypothetical protein
LNAEYELGMAPTAVCNEDEKESSLFHQTFLLDEEYKVSLFKFISVLRFQTIFIEPDLDQTSAKNRICIRILLSVKFDTNFLKQETSA